MLWQNADIPLTLTHGKRKGKQLLEMIESQLINQSVLLLVTERNPYFCVYEDVFLH